MRRFPLQFVLAAVLISDISHADLLRGQPLEVWQNRKECHISSGPHIVRPTSREVCIAYIKCDSAPTKDWAFTVAHYADGNGRCEDTAEKFVTEAIKDKYPMTGGGLLAEKRSYKTLEPGKLCTYDKMEMATLVIEKEGADPLCEKAIGCSLNGSKSLVIEHIACPALPKQGDKYYCPEIKTCWETRVKVTDPKKPDASSTAGRRSKANTIEASAISAGPQRQHTGSNR